MCIGVVIVAVFVGSRMWHSFGPQNDFAGDGKQDLVIQVHSGDSTTAIGETLHKQDVVRTVKVFLEAAQGNEAISAIQPGYYRLRTELPAASAVKALADPASRVGKVVIPEGEQLDDTSDVKTNATTPGIFTMIAKASCVELNGDKHCVAAADLRTAAEKTPLASLSVPPWAVASATAMGDDHRRIEGLIGPGTWNVNPSASPQEILESLISASSEHYVKSGLLDTATAMNMSPYNVLVVASLVQREAKPQDFAKVARVIYNRLAEHRKLEFDSTVNYPLDRREVATTDGDRGNSTPWNTYANDGLPATPICSPSTDALTRGRASRRRRLAVLRDHRPAGHDVVHPRLSTASGEHRVGQAQRCPRQRALKRRRCSVRRSHIRALRNCTWPPTGRSAWMGGPISGSSAAPTNCLAS